MSFETSTIIFEISSFVLSNCKTNEQWNDFWRCFFNDSKFRLFVIVNEQCIHFVLYSSWMFLNSTIVIVSLLIESNQIQFVKIVNFFSYVFRNLTNETKTKKDSIFDSKVKIVLNENFRYKFMTCILNRKQKWRVDLTCKRVCFDQIFQIVMKMLVQILKKMSCWRTNRWVVSNEVEENALIWLTNAYNSESFSNCNE